MQEVKIVWEDAKSHANEWLDGVSASGLELSAIETKGFLVSNSPQRVIVAQSKTENGDVHNLMIIPGGSVKKIIKEGK